MDIKNVPDRAKSRASCGAWEAERTRPLGTEWVWVARALALVEGGWEAHSSSRAGAPDPQGRPPSCGEGNGSRSAGAEGWAGGAEAEAAGVDNCFAKLSCQGEKQQAGGCEMERGLPAWVKVGGAH